MRGKCAPLTSVNNRGGVGILGKEKLKCCSDGITKMVYVVAMAHSVNVHLIETVTAIRATCVT